MAYFTGPNIVTDELIFAVDAGSTRSYPGSGTTTTSLVGSITSALNNGVGFSASNGGTFTFDGVDQYIGVPDSSVFNFTATPGVTIELLVYVTSYDSGGSMFICQQNGNTYGGFEFWSATNGTLRFNSNSSTNIVTSGVGTFELNKWKHLVCTANGTTGKIYIDGELIATASTTNFPSNVNGDLRIGDWAATGYRVNGSIPIVRLYNKVLTATEVLQNYNAQKSRFA